MNRVILVIIILFSCKILLAQPYMTKTLVQPKYFIIGVESGSFPNHLSNWTDTAESKKYGQQIASWITENKPKADTSSDKAVRFSYHDFSKLSPDQIQKFKLIERQLSYILKPQKEILLKDFYQHNPQSKGKSQDFYQSTTQIYFLSKKDIEYIKERIK